MIFGLKWCVTHVGIKLEITVKYNNDRTPSASVSTVISSSPGAVVIPRTTNSQFSCAATNSVAVLKRSKDAASQTVITSFRNNYVRKAFPDIVVNTDAISAGFKVSVFIVQRFICSSI